MRRDGAVSSSVDIDASTRSQGHPGLMSRSTLAADALASLRDTSLMVHYRELQLSC